MSLCWLRMNPSSQKKIPLILGTRTLDCVVENLLESEEDELFTTWKRVKLVHSLARKFQELGCHAFNDEEDLELESHACLSYKGVQDLLSYKEIIHTAKMEYLPPCCNTIVKGHMQLVLCRTKMNVIAELLRWDDPPVSREAHV